MKRLAAESAPAVLTRKADRRPVSGKVIVHSNNGDRAAGQLRDISTYGCNLTCDAEWLRLGRILALLLIRILRDGTPRPLWWRLVNLTSSEREDAEQSE